MTDATTALIKAYYDAFNVKDWDGFLSLLHEEVVHDLNQGEREVGRAAFRAFMERMNRCYAERLDEIAIMINADGSRAAAEFVVNGTYLATDAGLPDAHGQTYQLQGGAFFSVRGGSITRITNYYNLPDWLKQVGA